MKEIVVVSGKGGTGKTSLVSALSAIINNKVIVDCDVDAANLHLLMDPVIINSKEFYSGKKALIHQEQCVYCDKCFTVCKYDAILVDYTIDEIACEGCSSCYHQCPALAIEMQTHKSGDWFESKTKYGLFIHAKLGIAEENSGKLIAEIKNHARIKAKELKSDYILIDGSSGIGCPVIASLSGAPIALIVTEPTMLAYHDAQRIYALAKHSKTKVAMCINKYDINNDISLQLEGFCKTNNIELIGKIPYTKIFIEAQIKGKCIIEFCDNDISQEIKSMWNKLESIITENNND